jgi:hypothetical protein
VAKRCRIAHDISTFDAGARVELVTSQSKHQPEITASARSQFTRRIEVKRATLTFTFEA